MGAYNPTTDIGNGIDHWFREAMTAASEGRDHSNALYELGREL